SSASVRRRIAMRSSGFSNERPGDSPLGFRRSLTQVIVRGARFRPRRRAVRVEAVLGHGGDAAVLAHLDDLEAACRILVHPMLALELGDDALDRAPDAERLVAANAVKRLLLLEHARRRDRRAEVEARRQADHLL